MWRSAEGRAEAASVQTFWPRVHAGASYRRTHGVIGRIMRRVSQLRAPQGSNGQPELDRLNAPIAPAAMDAKPVPIRFRDPQIEMAHGAGGKASRKLVEGLFAPLLFGSSPGPLGDAA